LPDLSPFDVAVIGGGPAGLMAAEIVAASGARVTIYERMPSVGRKLLMAGRGGLNITHSEELPALLNRFGPREDALRSAIEAFPPAEVRTWCEDLGQPTFVGSSGRVFPKAMKASPLLRAWLRRLDARGVQLRTRHTWQGWNDAGQLVLRTPTGDACIAADATVLALGGASWPGLGSNGAWVDTLTRASITVRPLAPANSGFHVGWSKVLRERFVGAPLKRIAIMHGEVRVRGEIVLTEHGIEGGAIYALSSGLREAIAAQGAAEITIDLRPDVELGALARQLTADRRKQSLSAFLRKTAQLSPPAIGLLQEVARARSVPLGTLSPDALASRIKSLPLRLDAPASIARAISTAGGIAFDGVDSRYMLAARPGTFVAGEMLDWEAPTGGYLLQACLSTGAAAGRGVVAWLSAGR
jgi:uncharacterized flavoprotein (TIGR03862 family)